MSHDVNIHSTYVVPASIRSVMTPVTVVTGDPVSLSCEASGDPESSVRWTLSGQPFPNSIVSSRVSVVNGNQTLTISETQKSDEGTYTCTAVNSIQSDSEDVILVVYGTYVRKCEMLPFLSTWLSFCMYCIRVEPYHISPQSRPLLQHQQCLWRLLKVRVPF